MPDSFRTCFLVGLALVAAVQFPICLLVSDISRSHLCHLQVTAVQVLKQHIDITRVLYQSPHARSLDGRSSLWYLLVKSGTVVIGPSCNWPGKVSCLQEMRQCICNHRAVAFAQLYEAAQCCRVQLAVQSAARDEHGWTLVSTCLACSCLGLCFEVFTSSPFCSGHTMAKAKSWHVKTL